MNNGYRLTPSGLLVKSELEDTVSEPSYLPANYALETIPRGIPAVKVDDSDSDVDLVDVEFADDTDADAGVWGAQQPDPAGLQAAVRRARRVVKLQNSPELLTAKSNDDLNADIAAQRARRDAQRKLDQERDQAAIVDQREGLKHDAKMASWQRRTAEADAETMFALRKVTNPVTQLTTLKKARTWAPIVALIPAMFAVIAGGYNVGMNLSVVAPTTWLINWMIEPLMTVPIVAILIAQICGAVPAVADARSPLASLRENLYARVEAVLALVAVALNVGVHLIGPQHDSAVAGVWAVVPGGLLVSMYLAPKLRADLTAKFVTAAQAVEGDLFTPANTGFSTPGENPVNTPVENPSSAIFSTGSHLRGKNLAGSGDEPAEKDVEKTLENPVLPEPAQRTKAEARREFFRLVSRGEIDPRRDSVNTVAKTLATRWANAKEFITEWQRHHRN